MTDSAVCASAVRFSQYRFTGKERDAESGLDYFGARYYGSSMGRFMSPDPSGAAFSDPSNPQSWNMYSYVQNNPLIFIDPTGLALQMNCSTSEESSSTGDNSVEVTSSTHCDVWDDGSDNPRGHLPTNPPPSRLNVKLPAHSPVNPCRKSLGHRVLQGALGAVNLSLAADKTAALAATDLGLTAAAGPTGGASLVLAAAATTYGGTSIGGQAISGAAEIYEAFGGDPETADNLSTVGDILSGPVSGISTLMVTGNAKAAQGAANTESLFTAGTGAVKEVGTKAVKPLTDFLLTAFGITGNGCG